MTIYASVLPSWVRKLTGKPAFLTIADCESEARRIQFYAASSKAADNKALRIQSDFDFLALLIAVFIVIASSGDTLACTRIPRRLAFGIFGLPILVLINTLCMTKIIVDSGYFSSYG